MGVKPLVEREPGDPVKNAGEQSSARVDVSDRSSPASLSPSGPRLWCSFVVDDDRVFLSGKEVYRLWKNYQFGKGSPAPGQGS